METLDETKSSAPERVGFGPRLGALLLDGVFMGVLNYILAAVGLQAMKETAESGNAEGFMASIIATMAAVVLSAFIYGLIEGITGASPGKMVLGLQIGTQDGKKGDIALYMKRWGLKNANYICILLFALTEVTLFLSVGQLAGLAFFIGCFFALGDKRQALHDLIVKTAVYKKKEMEA